MIAVSVAVGLGAVVLASRWMSEQTSVSTTKIVVAANDIDLGTPLTPQMLKLLDWPNGSVPQGAIQDPKTLDTRVVKVSLQRGEPILESKLAPLGTKGGLSAVISEGKRAMTVRVNDVIGVAGFALPGNYVDIMVNTEDDSIKGEGKNKIISKIVLEHMLVLAVAQEASRDETKPKVVNAVTLEVTPEEAEKLDLARSVGSLSLVLRNQMDSSEVTTGGANKTNMLQRLNEPEAVPEKPAAPQTTVVEKKVVKKVIVYRAPARKASKEKIEVIKGTQTSDHEF
ncbi:MAG: Flp pilus assembly protein CpaB [Sulfuriferula sp.]|nr:Flp pilus assembly protein CpaB [Sulfuriferula sp.]